MALPKFIYEKALTDIYTAYIKKIFTLEEFLEHKNAVYMDFKNNRRNEELRWK